MNAENKKSIVITMDGGLIQEIEGIPQDVVIVVRDYDVEGVDEDDLTKDENGNECFESIWEKEDRPQA